MADKKHFEEPLSESEKQFRSLVSNMPAAIYRCKCDAHWTIIFFSEQINEITGYPPEDFIENKVRSYGSIIHSDDTKVVEDIKSDGIEERRPYHLEYRIIHKDESVRWIIERGRAIFGNQDEPLYLDGIIADNTTHRQLEKKLGARDDEITRLKEMLSVRDENLITRSIEFPPEYHQAGVSILNYFSTVLRKKYPDVKATVQIKQEDLNVTMTIDPIEGEREVIEKALDEYGLVVTGKMLPEQYTNDRLLKIELEGKLNLAKTEIENQKLLLQYQEREIKKQDEQSAIKDIQIDRLLNLLESGLKSGSEAKEQPEEQPEGVKVFISCAEDDSFAANKIYADLQKEGIVPWLAHKDISAGERTESTIRKAIKDSDYFLALLSTSSVNERGAFQKKLKQAFDILAEFSQDEIFIVPVRLEDCNPVGEILNELHIIDLHKSGYNSGLEKIVNAIQNKKTDGNT